MKITEAKLRQFLREESRRVKLFEQDQTTNTLTGLGIGGVVGGVPGAAIGAAVGRGAGNVSTRTAGFQTQLGDPKNPDEQALATDVLAVFYGAGRATTFFNMTADAGMFFKDMYTGDGGDFGDVSDDEKQNIVKQTFELVKKNALKEDEFYNIAAAPWKSGTLRGESPPQKDETMDAQGTNTYFKMLDEIQKKYAVTHPAAPNQQTPGAAPTAGAVGAPAAAGAAAGRAGAGIPKVAGVDQIQKMLNLKKIDGQWGTETQTAVANFMQQNVKPGVNVLPATVAVDQLSKNWKATAPQITSVNGTPVKLTGTPGDLLRFMQLLTSQQASVPRSPTPVDANVTGAPGVTQAAAEGSWRRGARINESDRRVRITWGR